MLKDSDPLRRADYTPSGLSGFGFCALALLLILVWIVWTLW